jgi:hypothetical protein
LLIIGYNSPAVWFVAVSVAVEWFLHVLVLEGQPSELAFVFINQS